MLSHIRRVDIELQSYCNRKCLWCPNKEFDRTYKKEMLDEVYSKILKELKENNFGKHTRFSNSAPANIEQEKYNRCANQPVLSFLGYQEPLSNPDYIKKRVEQAWNILPNHIELISHTNGDFLTKENLDGLLLTTLNIMDYDNKGIEYWTNKMTEAGVCIIDIDYYNEIITGIHRYIGNVTCKCNWTKHALLENRGGFFKYGDLDNMKWKCDMNKRSLSCPEPTYYMNIYYDGSIMPCCHMRPDNPNHKDFILGNVMNNTLTEIHYSNKAIDLKDKLSIDNGDYPAPCKYCQKIRSDFHIGDINKINYDGE